RPRACARRARGPMSRMPRRRRRASPGQDRLHRSSVSCVLQLKQRRHEGRACDNLKTPRHQIPQHHQTGDVDISDARQVQPRGFTCAAGALELRKPWLAQLPLQLQKQLPATCDSSDSQHAWRLKRCACRASEKSEVLWDVEVKKLNDVAFATKSRGRYET